MASISRGSINTKRRIRSLGRRSVGGLNNPASLTTALSGSNNDLVLTTVDKSALANQTRFRIVVSGNNTPLSVAVSGTLTAASLTTALTGTNNDLVYTAKDTSLDGNNITVRYVDPAANSQTLYVKVDGQAITVNLATNGGGTITSTAAQVAAAIAAHPLANALVSVANAGGNDGTGVVTALSATNLSGAAVAGRDITVNSATNGSAAATSTSAQVKAAIEASAAASALVSVAHATGNDGSGTVAALGYTAFTGGQSIVVGR